MTSAVVTERPTPSSAGCRCGRCASRAGAERHWPLSRVFAVGAAVAAVIVLAVLGVRRLRALAAGRGAHGGRAGRHPGPAHRAAAVGGAGQRGERGARVRRDRPAGVPGALPRPGCRTSRPRWPQLRALAPRGLRDFGPELDAVRGGGAGLADRLRRSRCSTARPAAVAGPGQGPVRPRSARRPRRCSTELDAQRRAWPRRRGRRGRLPDRGRAWSSPRCWSRSWWPPGSGCAGPCCDRCPGWPPRSATWRPAACTATCGPPARGRSSSSAPTSTRCGVRILRDLDEAQQANRRLDEQARDLERSNRDLEQFAYVASHDLQEPLRKVSSFCQLLQRRYGGPARRAGRPVHRVRGRRRAAHAAADQRPARVLPGRADHRGLRAGRPGRGRGGRRGPAGDGCGPRSRAPSSSASCPWSPATARCSASS